MKKKLAGMPITDDYLPATLSNYQALENLIIILPGTPTIQ